MALTSELRWFYPGSPPEAIAHWFETECPQQGPENPETRDDLYLFTPNCDYLNIKWRQDSLEIKWRQAEWGEVQFGDCLSGNLETWQKCACEELTAAMPPDAETKETWVRVRKRRSQRFYQVQNATLEPISGDRPRFPRVQFRTNSTGDRRSTLVESRLRSEWPPKHPPRHPKSNRNGP